MAEITETIEPVGNLGHVLLIHTRGSNTRTVEFESEPTEAERQKHRDAALASFDAMDASPVPAGMQDRRKRNDR